MKTLFLRPMDVWMFRDGRPFDAGSAHRAESMFPPYPSVIQGAIRTYRMLRENIKPDKVREIIGDAKDYKDLQVRGPFVAKMENGKATRYYPMPADAIVRGDLTLSPATLTDLNSIQNKVRVSHPTDYLIGYQEMLEKANVDKNKKPKSKQKELLWISEIALKDYKPGNSVPATPESELFVREDRLGIGIDYSMRTVKEGMLYEAEFIRPCENVGLLVEVGGKGYEDFPDSGVWQLGGESRSAWFEAVKADPMPVPQKGTHGYKVYFITPAYFKDGSKTDWTEYFGKPEALKGAAIGRYESIGGFDRASKDTHKPAYRYVPAGSVYYFECDENKNISQLTDSGSFKQIGFGQVILKEW